MRDHFIKAQKSAQQLNSNSSITPKHLADEFDVSGRWIRIFLRRKYRRPKPARWRFNPAEAKSVRAYLRKAVQR